MRASSRKGGEGRLLYPRVYGALALLVAALALVFLLDSWAGAYGGDEDSSRMGGAAVSPSLAESVLCFDGGSVSVESERVLSRFSDAPSQEFADEVLSFSGGRYSIDGDGVVAGFLFPSGSAPSIGDIQLLLEERGWRVVSSGQDSIATLAKSEGAFRWASVSCESLSDGTAVVINTRRLNGE